MITTIQEHYNGRAPKIEVNFDGRLSFDKEYSYQFAPKKEGEKLDCFRVYSNKEQGIHEISNGYFIGVDWVSEHEKVAIYVEPKLNVQGPQTDYLKMLFSALEHPEVSKHTDELFEIKWDSPPIEISQQQDLLTPLLVVQFLRTVQHIVRKGLKKSYYKVEQNLYGKVKGKIQVGQTIKQNLFKNKSLNTVCSYDEFGVNGLENRLLKKALVFVKRYLPTLSNLNSDTYTANVFNYINPAFEGVSDEVSLNDIKHTKTNVFYKEYEEAIKLAKIILKRFGYNITNVSEQSKVTTPPFWIDMSKLFELYVYGKLLDVYPNLIEYQFEGKRTYLDFLLKAPAPGLIVDAKYKPKYSNEFDIDDIRQLSGYARDNIALEKLGHIDPDKTPVIPCLIIYPSKKAEEVIEYTKRALIQGFLKFEKLGIKLPTINNSST